MTQVQLTGNATPSRQTTRKNIESILKLEKDDERQLSPFHRLSHGIGWFVGTGYFVILQGVLALGWILLNVGLLPNTMRFDPYPFPLLSFLLALEAVLLTSFVLIRQNAIDLRSERRNHLDLQINLLAEKEATSILNCLRAVAEALHVDVSNDTGSKDLGEDTAVEQIARDLRSKEEKRN